MLELIAPAGSPEAVEAAVVTGETLSVEIPEGYATYSVGKAVDFATATGVRAYVAAEVDGNVVKMQQVTGTVAANTGLLLQKVGTEAVAIPVVASGTEYADNLLKPADGSAVKASVDGACHYVFAKQEGVIGFYNLTADYVVPAGKAYLEVSSGTAPQFIGFGDNTTGINEERRVKSEEFATAQYYDLQGRHVAQPTKGLYIVNGKKIVIK